jgi:hypothetical protein
LQQNNNQGLPNKLSMNKVSTLLRKCLWERLERENKLSKNKASIFGNRSRHKKDQAVRTGSVITGFKGCVILTKLESHIYKRRALSSRPLTSNIIIILFAMLYLNSNRL